MTAIVDERPLADPVTVKVTPFCAVLMLERAEHERRYFSSKHATLRSIRGDSVDLAEEEVQAGAIADGWHAIASALRAALYGGPDLSLGDHFAYPEKRLPGVYRFEVGGKVSE